MPSFSDIGSSLLKKLTPNKSGQAVTSIPQFALTDLRNLNRPAPSWRWNLVMPALPGAEPAKISPPKNFLSSISALISKDPQALSVVCESISVPSTLNLGRQDRYFNGHMVAFPGLPSYETVNAVFYESEDYATLSYFRKWQSYIYDPASRVYGVPSDYGLDVEFIALPVTNYTDVKRYAKISMYTCWPISVQRLNYGNTTDRIRIEVELAFHTMDVTIVGGASNSSSKDLGSVVNAISKWRS